MLPGKQILFLALCFLIASCKKSGERICFKSLGKTVKESRPAAAFDFIYLHDHINLVITQDTFHRIEVEAPGNLIRFIKTDIEGNNLTIKNQNKCDFLRSYKYEINVYVSLISLGNIYFTGSGHITTANTIKTPEIDINFWSASGTLSMALEAGKARCNMHTGPGDITLKGSAGSGSVYSMGNGFMRLGDFPIGYAFVNNSGTGDFFISVEKEMTVAIHSLGSVYYSGDPGKIKTEITGKGELIKL